MKPPFKYRHATTYETVEIILGLIGMIIIFSIMGYFINPVDYNSTNYPEDTCQDAGGGLIPC